MAENVENSAVQNMDIFEQRAAKIREYQDPACVQGPLLWELE